MTSPPPQFPPHNKPAPRLTSYLGAILPGLLSVILFGMAVFWFVVPYTEEAVVSQKRRILEDVTYMVWDMLGTYQSQVDGGELTLIEAQNRARNRMRAIRLGPQREDYIFIVDLDLRSVMHPYRQQLEGRDMSDVTDASGRHFIRDLVELAREKGEGPVTYQWRRERPPNELLPKFAYVRLFKPWGWVIGTGMFFDDVQAELNQMTHALTLVGIGVLAMVVLLSFFIAWRQYRLETARLAAEQASREADMQYRRIVETANEGIFFTDSAFTLIFANEKFLEMLGYSLDEVQGRLASDFMHPDELADHQARIANRLSMHKDVYERRFIRGDGQIFWALMAASPIPGRDGGFSGALVMLTDITRRKRMEDELRESEGIFRAIFEQSYHFIGTLSLDGILLKANSTALTYAGIQEADVIGKPFWEAPWWTHSPELQAHLRAAIAEAAQGQYVRFEATHPDAMGRIGHVDFSIKPVKDREGRVVLLVPEGREYTAKRQAEMELKQREVMFRAITENSLDGISRFDREGRHLYVNPVTERLFGLEREKFLGRAMRELDFPANLVAPWERAIERVFRQSQPVRLEFQLPSGTWIDALLVPEVNQAGEVEAVMASSRDISERHLAEEERKKLEQQLLHAQKMEAVGTLAGGMAHDLNNILQVIAGYLEVMIERGLMNSEGLDYVGELKATIDRGSDLIKSLLAFSRRDPTVLTPMDLNETVTAAAKMLTRTIPRMIGIELRLQPDLPLIKGSPGELEQVLMNLGTNARDAMLEGGRIMIETTTLTVTESEAGLMSPLEPGRYILLSFSDTGRGMPPEVVARIFEPFFTTKAFNHGSGLGLAMAYGIVINHGGRINCYSEPDRGTVFRMYFPVLEGVHRTVQREESPESAPRGTETVLLVDDEKAILEATGEILDNYGYVVLPAASGEEALALFKEERERVDLVVLDLGMPGMGGRACLRELLALDPELPIIVASGYGVEMGGANGQSETGARLYMAKPYRITNLLNNIRKVLDEVTGASPELN